MAKNLKQILDAYNANTLVSIAQTTGLIPPDGKKPKKADLLDLLGTKLGTAKRVNASLAQLDDLARAVLMRLQLSGGTSYTRRFQRDLTRAKLVAEEADPSRKIGINYGFRSYRRNHQGGDPRSGDSAVFKDVMARLTLHALVFTENASNTYGKTFKFQFETGEILFIPAEIAAHLPQPDPQYTVDDSWEPKTVDQGDPTLYLRDLYLYWDFVRRQPLGLTQQGYVRKNSLKVVNRSLLQPDPHLPERKNESASSRLYLLRQQLEQLDLIFLSGNELVAGVEQAHPFWLADPETQIVRLVQTWISSVDEKSPDSAFEYYAQWGRARSTLATVLAEQRDGAWIALNQLVDLITIRDESFLFSPREQLIRDHYRYYGRYSDDQFIDRIEVQERRFVSRSCTFPLLELGLIELGYIGEGEWDAVRTTDLGRRVLTRALAEDDDKRMLREKRAEDAQTVSDGGQVIVQPNFHILAMGPVSIATLARLDACAERQKADVSVFEYQLTRDSVYQAQQVGMAAAEITAFLAEVSGVPLPQNIRRSLDEWGARHQRITFRTGVTLLQTIDDDGLSSLMGSPALRADLEPTPVSSIAFVAHNHRRRVANRLIAQGILPAHEDGKPQSANGGVAFHPDGAVVPIHALPSLQLSSRLNRFAEQDVNGGWRITPASIRRAGGDRARVDEILADMKRLQRGDLPDGLVEQVKRWGGYYGTASVDALTMIEFSDAKVLRELLKNRHLRALLKPFKAGDRALATLAASDLPAVKELLLERGIAVESGIGN